MDDVRLTWGEWIADQYTALGMTQEEFAQAVGIGQGTVSNWVSGRVRKPRRIVIPALSRVLAPLGITQDQIFERAGYPRGAAYVAPAERFGVLHDQSVAYDDLEALRGVQRALERAMDMLQTYLDERGVQIVRAPGTDE